jgi:hypothetical protein
MEINVANGVNDEDEDLVDAGNYELDEGDDGDVSDDELDIIDIPEDDAFGESEETIPENEFSRLLRLGTRASNQRFGLIHQRLEITLANRTGKMG